MRKAALIAMAAVLLGIAVPCAAGAGAGFITGNYSSIFQEWEPIVLIAVILSISIAAAYYMAGVLLDNKKIKANAIGEIGQAIGAAIIMIAVVAAIAVFGSGELSYVSVISPSSMGNLCAQLGTSRVTLLNSGGAINGNAVLTNMVCSQIVDIETGTANDPTSSVDYGLLANYVIIANVTRQDADNLNSLYIFENWVGFLSHFVETSQLCTPTCLWTGKDALSAMISLNSSPLAGYDKISDFTQPLEFQANLTFYVLFMQLLMIALFLFAWPYLIAAGLVLRTTFITRRAGGLLIAIGVTVVLLYPLMGILEYNAFNGANPSPIGINGLQLGTGALSAMALNELLPNGQMTVYGSNGINFFVLPNAGEVINANYCMPPADNVLLGEMAFAAPYLVPGYGLGTAIFNSAIGLVGALPYVYVPSPNPIGSAEGCGPTNALNTMMEVINLYGVAFVSGILFPFINILVALAAVISLSKLFGGDTDLIGLGKLI
jgi:hypothetical protein